MLVPAIVVAVAACAENGPTGPGPVLRCTDPAPIDLPIGGIALISWINTAFYALFGI